MNGRLFAGMLILSGLVAAAFGQAPPAAAGEGRGQGRGPGRGPAAFPVLFFKEDFQKEGGEAPLKQENLTNANLELKLYGIDAKQLQISGGGTPANPTNMWTGLTTSPVAVTLRDKENYVDLTGLAKLKWVTRASSFHAVRPVVKLADGTMLIGDHADSNLATFLESEIAFAGMRWVRLDPERVVTKGPMGAVGGLSTWVDNPDLSKVDEVGFADLMPGSGHGAGGWVNVAHIEVYGKPVKR